MVSGQPDTALWRLPQFLAMGFIGCVLLLLSGGCTESQVVQVNEANFRHEVLESDQPVLVNFDKDGCPICIPTTFAMESLVKEYQGRAKIAHFSIMTAYWTFPSWEIKNRYQIYYVPTVILFDKGVEVERWNVMYFEGPYRDGLNSVLANRAKRPSPANQPNVDQPINNRIP